VPTTQTTPTTIISDEVRIVAAVWDGHRALIDPAQLPEALGWELKPEGLCRDDLCVPVRDRSSILVEGGLDLAGVADVLRRPVVLDEEAHIVAVALPAEERRSGLESLQAPSFTLPDLGGVAHSLAEWGGKKKLLVAFASW
jgi:hypothetical protein